MLVFMKKAYFVYLLLTFLIYSPSLLKAVNTKADTAILFDPKTKISLFEKNSHVLIHPSSMTKVMTAVIVLDAVRKGKVQLTDKVRVSPKAWRTEGSRMFLEPRLSPTLEEIINGILVVSGNDACIAAAEHIAGNEENFVNLMNDRARKIGMKSTHFTNTSGLPDKEHQTTLYDLALLASYALNQYPEITKYTSKTHYRYNKITQPNLNSLLNEMKHVIGLKTGYSSKGGYGLISCIEKDGTRLVAVVNGLKNHRERINDSRNLLKWGIHNFKTYKLYERGAVLTEVPVWQGKKDTVPLIVKEDIYLTFNPEGEKKKLSLNIKNFYKTPLDVETPAGTLNIINNKGDIEKSFDVYPLFNVETASLLERAFKIYNYYRKYESYEQTLR